MRIADLVGSHDARPHRREAVLPLRYDPLPRAAAIARRHVVDDGVAEHMVQCVALRDVARGAADDHRKFGFPVELLRDLRVVADRVVPRDDRGRRLREDHRLLREFFRCVEAARRFSNMLGIVKTDTEDILARARDRREQGDITLGQRGADQVGGRRAFDRFAEETQTYRAQVDEIEHRRGQILPDRVAEIFDVDHKPVVDKAEPGFGLDRAISHKAHR